MNEFKTIVADSFSSEAELKEALHASTWLPVAISGTTTYHGQRAIDGGVLTALPFRLAMRDSCTHIMSLSTHPMGVIHEKITVMNRYTRRHLNKIKPSLGDKYVEALNQKYHDQHMLAEARNAADYSEPYILDLAPLSGTPDVKRHELQTGKLIEAARSAYEVMYAALAGRPSSAVRDHFIRAMPRFSIAERNQDDRRLIRLFDPGSGEFIPWGVARDQ